MAVRIPWTEQYRPVTLDDVVGNPNIIATLKGFIITQVVPQLIILWGLPGIGKTSAAFAFARDYYIRKGVYDEEGKLMPDFFPPLLVMRGSVSIEEIRGRVHEFMRHAPPKGARRIIIFDEAEMISRAALLELRPFIERYAKTCSIVFTTNVDPASWLDMFDPLLAAVRDRALIYHFLRPTGEEIAGHLRRIVREEEFEIPDAKIRSIAGEAEGSVRKAVELLQAEYARIIALRPPEVDWAMAWADYNVVSRNFDVFPSEMRIEVKKFVREWERKYGKGIKVMGAPLQPCTVEDAERMEQYSDYVSKPPEVPEVPEVELPRIHATKVEVGMYKAGEYYIMLVNPEKYGDRPILTSIRGTIKAVEEYVALGKELYDTEALGLIPAPGEEWWEELSEELKTDAIIYWTAEDVEWGPNVEDDRVIYHKTYVRRELEALKVDELRRICSVKGLSPAGRKAELISRVLRVPPPKPPEVPLVPPPVAIPPPVEKGLRKADEEELRVEFNAELLRRTISPRKWIPIFNDEILKWRVEYVDWPSDRVHGAVKADLLSRVIPDIVELAKPLKPPVARAPPIRPPPAPPVPVRVEVPVERKPDIVTRRCWKCDGLFEADRDLERRVREAITTIRGPRDVIYREPLLGLPMLFYYLCEEHRNERFGYRDIYDALAFQLAEARSSGYKKLTLTKEVLRDRGLIPEDIAEIQVRVTRWLPPSPSE